MATQGRRFRILIPTISAANARAPPPLTRSSLTTALYTCGVAERAMTNVRFLRSSSQASALETLRCRGDAYAIANSELISIRVYLFEFLQDLMEGDSNTAVQVSSLSPSDRWPVARIHPFTCSIAASAGAVAVVSKRRTNP